MCLATASGHPVSEGWWAGGIWSSLTPDVGWSLGDRAVSPLVLSGCLECTGTQVLGELSLLSPFAAVKKLAPESLSGILVL